MSPYHQTLFSLWGGNIQIQIQARQLKYIDIRFVKYSQKVLYINNKLCSLWYNHIIVLIISNLNDICITQLMRIISNNVLTGSPLIPLIGWWEYRTSTSCRRGWSISPCRQRHSYRGRYCWYREHYAEATCYVGKTKAGLYQSHKVNR